MPDISFAANASWVLVTQAYVFSAEGYAIRVRLTHEPGEDVAHRPRSAYLTAKSPRIGTVREEYEIELSPIFAAVVIAQTKNVVIKKRYSLADSYDTTWDIDEFQGANYGLVIAECEASPEALRRLTLPPWVGAEIVDDPRYDNESLAATPYSTWQ